MDHYFLQTWSPLVKDKDARTFRLVILADIAHVNAGTRVLSRRQIALGIAEPIAKESDAVFNSGFVIWLRGKGIAFVPDSGGVEIGREFVVNVKSDAVGLGVPDPVGVRGAIGHCHQFFVF